MRMSAGTRIPAPCGALQNPRVRPDMAGSEGRNPLQDLAHLRREIDLYDPTLSGRPWIIVANKMDLPGAKENLKVLRRDFPKIEVFGISAQGRADLEPLLQNLEDRIFGPTV